MRRVGSAALAAGPLAGLQGGAVASLLTAEIEAMAGAQGEIGRVSMSVILVRTPKRGPNRPDPGPDCELTA